MKKLKMNLLVYLLIGVNVVLNAQVKNDTIPKEEKKFEFVVAPSYDYRPVMEHSIAVFNKNILRLKGDNLYVSEGLFSKALSNKSLMAEITNQLYLDHWRFYLSGVYSVMMNKMAASEIGIPLSNQFGIENKIFTLQGFVKRKLMPNTYFGVGYEIVDIVTDMKFSNLGLQGMENTKVSTYLSQPEFILEYDVRDNVVYPTRGFFISLQTCLVSDDFGSKIENLNEYGQVVEDNDYMYTRNYADIRYYHSLSGDWKSVLASRLAMRAATGDLPAGLWETANTFIRGYTEGNYTGKQLYYFDVEWRKYITDRIGFAAFGTAGFIGEDFNGAFSAGRFVPSAGAGIRVQLLKASRVAFRCDYAFGRDNENSVYFGISEYF